MTFYGQESALKDLKLVHKYNKLELIRVEKTLKNDKSIYLDFIVDGSSLDQDATYKLKDQLVYSTILSNHIMPIARRELVDVLLGKRPADMPRGRTGLYYCPLCYDLSDGVFTVGLSFTDESVTWSKFGWQDSNEGVDIEDALPPVRFERKTYTKLISSALFEFEIKELRQILNEIDFIGVADEVNDEYDCMISDILTILRDNGDEKKIRHYLKKELKSHFELSAHFLTIRRWSRKIFSWWVNSPELFY